MAKLTGKSKFSLDFQDFMDYAYKIEELAGQEALKIATENALNKSKDYANEEAEKALKASFYSFTAGVKGSKGESLNSLKKVSQIPIEWSGTEASAFIGVDFEEAPQVAILMLGDPHHKADANLRKAMQVKGVHKARVREIQKEEFDKVLNEVMNK